VLTGPDTVEDVVLDLPLTTFGDGGWYWFDVYAGEDPVVITSAEWTAPAAEARTRGTISLAMTTLNKVDYALDNIAQIAGSADLREHLDVMYVVDQGSDRLVDHTERLGPLQETLGDQLEIIEQGNIGGSGGFSRGMYESARAERSTYVVNCDDDIVIEPESLIRMLTFADYARTPTLVGAHMFDLNDRSVLYTYGESVDLWRFLWGPTVPGAEYGHDFASRPLRSTPWLHRRVDADYNGWWMCLIPLEVVREIGLSLPVFIKWDDSEYGLRAKRAGFPTVSLPGAGVWHMSWADKDDAVDWQAYFHERNRLIAALLHSPYERGGAVVRDSEAIDVKHLLSMQYGAVSARLLAQRDVLAGPGSLHREIGSKLPEVRKLIRATPDGVTASEVTDFPAVSVEKPLRRGRKNVRAPHRALLPLWAVKNVTRQLLAPVPGRSRQHPQQEVAHGEATWWNLAGFDSALVSTADGSAVSWYHRDPARFRSLLGQVLRTHAALTRHWPRLAREYRAAAGDLASFEAWERTFEDAR
jgi:galactofuranosylgalactofuranosylrhamnosyl-N-acetylglucosaminyl-diphospho-decaprenol beta-1,5/1,6-galactofuranosyltransferase